MKNSGLLLTTLHIQIITGKGERQCQREADKIREFVKKTKQQPLTLFDGETFYHITVDEIIKRFEEFFNRLREKNSGGG